MHSDTRHGLVEGKQVLIKSEVRDEKGRIVRKSLDKPDATCTVYVWVKKYVPPKPPLRSDSTPPCRSSRSRCQKTAQRVRLSVG